MYLHLGQTTTVRYDEITGIFDIENTTVMRSTRDYLENAQKTGRVINVSYDLPASFVICDEGDGVKVYISSISPATLRKRIQNSLI